MMAKSAETKTTETAKSKNYYNELVEVRLFKDNDKYKDDVFVAVNGVGMIVPRGKDVKIPRKYAIALKNSEAQDSFAAQHCMELSKNADASELN
ncbi:MAG: hypothetical protein E7395_05225 [Ruminococcaceae bacterium]|nr:hypothetical protein [Oscillospiraceae bacterium]